MKRNVFLLLPLLFIGLCGCDSDNSSEPNVAEKDNNVISNTPKQSIQLTASNFATYVATNSSCSIVMDSASDVIYYTYFIGADYCKFINCKVSYSYVSNTTENQNTLATVTGIVPLTLSGDGEAKPFYVRSQNRNQYYYLVVVSVSGTVEVYR